MHGVNILWRMRDLRIVLDLAQIRRMQGRTQAQVARALGCSQASVSRLEHGADVTLSMAARYLAACGADQLRLVCQLGRRAVEVVVPSFTRVSEDI